MASETPGEVLAPDCPRCGCNDTTVVKPPDPARDKWWGAGLAECRHCGLRYNFRGSQNGHAGNGQPAPAAPAGPQRIIPVVPCERCDTEMRVTQTRKQLRYYKCPDCGHTRKLARADAAGVGSRE